MTKLTVYQKKTCITCKKALAFLEESGTAIAVKDIISEAPSKGLLEKALDEENLSASLNSRSTIYKAKNLGKTKLSKSELIQLMLEDPNLIKRPLIVSADGKHTYQGFDAETLKKFIQQ